MERRGDSSQENGESLREGNTRGKQSKGDMHLPDRARQVMSQPFGPLTYGWGESSSLQWAPDLEWPILMLQQLASCFQPKYVSFHAFTFNACRNHAPADPKQMIYAARTSRGSLRVSPAGIDNYHCNYKANTVIECFILIIYIIYCFLIKHSRADEGHSLNSFWYIEVRIQYLFSPVLKIFFLDRFFLYIYILYTAAHI